MNIMWVMKISTTVSIRSIMGFDDYITIKNQRGITSNTCKTYESNAAVRNNTIAENVWKTDANGVVTKFESRPHADYEKVSTFKTDKDGTVTEFDYKKGTKVRSWKTDEDGKTFEYDKNGKKKTDKYIETDEDGVTREFKKSFGSNGYSITETFISGNEGSLIKFDNQGNFNSMFKSCGEREAFGKGFHEFPELKAIPEKPLPEWRAPKTEK